MVEAISLKKVIDDVHESNSTRILAILIAPPCSETGANLKERIAYYHHRSTSKINFYLVGYGAYWNNAMFPDQKDIIELNGTTWSYSSEAEANFVAELEEKRKWKFSGESELILLDSKNGKINFESTIVLNIDKLLKDEVISSVNSLFEMIIREVQHLSSIDKLSDSLGFKSTSENILDFILGLLLKGAKDVLKKGVHFRVQ